MANRAEILMIVTGFFLALAAFAVYRWRQERRVDRITTWVTEYVLAHYGQVPAPLQINCTDDHLWPVLVAFDCPRSGTRRRLQFSCAGAPSTYALVSVKEAIEEKT